MSVQPPLSSSEAVTWGIPHCVYTISAEQVLRVKSLSEPLLHAVNYTVDDNASSGRYSSLQGKEILGNLTIVAAALRREPPGVHCLLR